MSSIAPRDPFSEIQNGNTAAAALRNNLNATIFREFTWNVSRLIQYHICSICSKSSSFGHEHKSRYITRKHLLVCSLHHMGCWVTHPESEGMDENAHNVSAVTWSSKWIFIYDKCCEMDKFLFRVTSCCKAYLINTPSAAAFVPSPASPTSSTTVS